MARCFLLSFKGRQGGWPKIHRVTKCQQYDGLQQLEVETVETFWVRPYSPSSSCPAGPCWRWGGAKKRQASWAPVWIGVRWLDWRPESWRIFTAGASPTLAHLHHAWRHGGRGRSYCQGWTLGGGVGHPWTSFCSQPNPSPCTQYQGEGSTLYCNVMEESRMNLS